jgi:hypothetical protein
MGSESNRISRLMADTRACLSATALAKARATYGSGPCATASCKGSTATATATATLGADVGTSSDLLEDKMRSCGRIGYISPYSCVPESIRLQREQIRVADCYAAAGPYPKVFPSPCPPTRYSPYIHDGGGNIIGFQPLGPNKAGLDPILQMKNCPLPNKPYNPVLPG